MHTTTDTKVVFETSHNDGISSAFDTIPEQYQLWCEIKFTKFIFGLLNINILL